MIRTDRNAAVWVLLAATLAVGACELGLNPTSVTEARNQLRRGGERTTSLVVPLTVDTFAVTDVLDSNSTTTTPGGLVGVTFDADSVSVDVGSQLQFSNLTLSAFNFSFNQMLQTTQQVVGVAFPSPPIVQAAAPPDIYPVTLPGPTRFSTSGGSNVASATVGSGYIVRSMTNNTNCAATSVSIDVDDSTGVNLLAFPGLPVPIGGPPVVDSLPAAGITVSNYVALDGGASFGVCVPISGSVAVSMTFRPMTLTAVNLQNVNETFNQTFNAFAGEPRITAVDTVVASSGSFSITVQNRLPIADNITVRLNGITKAGVVQQQNLVVPAADGVGGYTNGTLTFDLANATIVPAAVIPQVTGSATAASATITPTNATNAAVVSGSGSIVVERLVGALNPATTPELSVTTENADEFTRAQIDLGDFEDAVRLSHLNSATVNITVVNSAQVPLSLTNFRVGAVRCTPNVNPCQPVRVSGQLDFEKDGSGNPIFINVVDPGQTTLSVARGNGPGAPPSTKTVALGGALLLDTLVHKLLGNTRMALAAVGGTTIGDGAPSRISRADSIKVKFGLSIGLDLTLPVAGVTFKRKQVVGGADLSDTDADEITKRLLQATLSAAVSNGTPFGVGLQISLIRDSSALTVDGLLALPICPLGQVPTATCRVSLVSINVPGGTVNTSGLVTAPAPGNVAVSLSGNTARPLLGKQFTIALLIQLVPGTGGAGRGALRPSDRLIVNARAQLDIRTGGS